MSQGHSVDEREVRRRQSFRTIRAARSARGLSGTQKGILMILATYADGPSGEGAFPGLSTLAAESCFDEKTVRNALKALEALGFIEQTGERKNSHGRPTKIRRLDLDALAAAASDTVGPVATTRVGGSPAKTGSSTRENRAERPPKVGTKPSDLPGTLSNNSDAADAAPRCAHLDNPRLDAADLEVLVEAEGFLRAADSADPAGGNIEHLLGVLDPYYKDVGRWFARALRNKLTAEARRGFVLSHWWEFVVERTEEDDRFEFESRMIAANYDEAEVGALYEQMTANGLRHPGLASRTVDEHVLVEKYGYVAD